MTRRILKSRYVNILGALALVAMMLVGVAVLPSMAQEDPPPIAVEPLTPRSDFKQPGTDFRAVFKIKLSGHPIERQNLNAPSLSQVARITVQPGAQFPWHTHPGPVIVNVAQGELVYVPADDCVHRSYPAGSVFVDAGRGHVHSAYNPTDGETVLVATFFELPAEGPLTIPVDPPANCEL